ncbi:MAG TPA: branched-chain amino acid transaminase [Methylomirabilota bacterium]|nr:branched-chain amino acid transaminase [Methylomirabilota bacterium]
MAIEKTELIWHNGKFIRWDDAKIHVLSHVVSYGSAVFEGIRCYHTKQGPAIFRLREHMQRMVNSAKIYRMEFPVTLDELCQGAQGVIRVNRMDSAYIRPIALRGYGDVGVSPQGCPVEVYIACYPWGAYLGAEALEQGVDVCVSSWTRIAPNTLPAMSKSAANYMNSQLIRMEAASNGYSEGIALDAAGYVSEGSGENIFVVADGVVFTPPLAASVLPGITRQSLVALCEDLKIPIREQMIPREMLYLADEVFLTGTAAELTPLRSVDHITVGTGRRGPVAQRLQEEFFAIVRGEKPDHHNWLTPVGVPTGAAVR